MKADRLPSEVIDQKEKEAKKKKAEDLKKLAAAKKTKGGKSGVLPKDAHFSQTDFAGTQVPGNPGQSIEDIMETSERFNPRELGEVTEKFGASEDILAEMPMAECPKKLQTQLLPYQRQALA